jgi:hypothetical protein
MRAERKSPATVASYTEGVLAFLRWAAEAPPAARVLLTSLLDKLRSASAQGRRGRLAVVGTLTEKGGA